MSNYTNIKASIDANITTNGQEEITGAILNEVMKSVVDTLGDGYRFAGIVTPSSAAITTDNKVFVVASEAGTYTNFGGLTVAEGELAFLYYDTTWHKGAVEVSTENPVDVQDSGNNADLDISDEDGNVLARFENGHFRVKNFDSSKNNANLGFDSVDEFSEDEDYAVGDIVLYDGLLFQFVSPHEAGEWNVQEVEQTNIMSSGTHPVEVSDSSNAADLDISDENGNVLARLSGGHIKTKNFDSQNVYDKAEVDEAIASGGIVSNTSYEGEKIDISAHKFLSRLIHIFTATGENMQGFAVFGNNLISLSNKGICQLATYDENIVTEGNRFNLASFATTNHANCASFGHTIPDGYDFPYLYVARCYAGYRTCLVERLESNRSTLMQTISIGTYRGEVDGNSDIQYVVSDDNFLYVFGNTKSAFSTTGNKFVVAKFPVPIVDGDIALNMNDAIEFYFMEDYGYTPGQVLQGCCIKNGLMFLPVGYGNSSSPSQMLVWNLGKKRIQNRINLSSITTGEIEDCAIWSDKLMARYGNGNLYLIQF